MIKSLIHHAYGFAGDAEHITKKLLSEFEKEGGYRVKGNPDFRSESFEVFGIDEARLLTESSTRKAVAGGKKVFIISVRGITSEAQNALLKLLEEPPQDTHFFFIVPTFETLLQTLRSRLYLVRPDTGAKEDTDSDAVRFLGESVAGRIALVQKMLKALEGEKKEKEDSTDMLAEKGNILALLDALERKLGEDSVKNAVALSELLDVKKYSRDRAPSFKLLLEHLALVLPKL